MAEKKHIVLFDLDGTLCDTGLDLANSVNFARIKSGLKELEIDLIKSFVGDGIHKLMERSLPGDEIKLFDECMNTFKEHYYENCAVHTRLYPGGMEALLELKDRYILGVLTNKDSRYSVKILKELNAFSHLDEVVGGDTLGKKKPEPEGVFYFSKKYSIPVTNIVMVGDHKTDLELCKRSGAVSVFCKFGMGVTGDFVPNYEINSFNELSSLLQKIFSDRN